MHQLAVSCNELAWPEKSSHSACREPCMHWPPSIPSKRAQHEPPPQALGSHIGELCMHGTNRNPGVGDAFPGQKTYRARPDG